jgi:glycosyltransferase involved in cell wall biosynthesis
VFLEIERWLARRTDALVAVSEEVRDDLIRLGVAGPERFSVIPLGFDLAPFTDDDGREQRRAAVREQWGVAPDAEVVTLIARLVPIKRVDRFLRIALALADRPDVRFVIVGDGELRDELVDSQQARSLGDKLVWAGFRRDMPDVCFASDVVTLTSDNEGTPVSLIEAQAAAVPVVGTDVGGVRSAVRDGQTGFIAGVDDEPAFAGAIAAILDDRALAQRLALSGREHSSRSFSIGRLVHDLDTLYRSLLSSN